MEYGTVIDLMRSSLTGELNDDYFSVHPNLFSSGDWNDFFHFLSEHTIAPLFCDLIKYIPDHCDVKKVWRDLTFRNINYYYRLLDQQKQILNAFQNKNIPVAVLKGTSVAKYYLKPQLRGFGDIDLLVKPEDYERAVKCLFSIGCEETSTESELERGRHRSFHSNSISIELHHFFHRVLTQKKLMNLMVCCFALFLRKIAYYPTRRMAWYYSHIFGNIWKKV